eukprot:703488_1
MLFWWFATNVGLIAMIIAVVVYYQKECPAGQFLDGSGECTPCAKGTFSLKAASMCTPCESGTFADKLGMSKCTPCAEGTSNDKTGQEECPKCKVGHFSGAQAKTCTKCAKNTFANVEGSSECTDCPDGQASKPGQKECGCADADHGVNDIGECVKVCAAGHFAASDGG